MTHGPGGTQSLHTHHRRKEGKDRDLTLDLAQATVFVVGVTVRWIPGFITPDPLASKQASKSVIITDTDY